MNNVTLSGRLGKDPELQKTTTGKSVVNTSIAIEEFKKDENAPANWQSIQVWNQSAEFLAENAKAGDKIFISGRIQNDTWEDNGNKRYRSYVIVDRLEMLPKSSSKKEKTMANGSLPGPKDTPAERYQSEDLPF